MRPFSWEDVPSKAEEKLEKKMQKTGGKLEEPASQETGGKPEEPAARSREGKPEEPAVRRTGGKFEEPNESADLDPPGGISQQVVA